MKHIAISFFHDRKDSSSQALVNFYTSYMIMRVHGLLILCTPVPVFIGEMVQNHNFFYERIVVVDLFIVVMPDGNQNIRDG